MPRAHKSRLLDMTHGDPFRLVLQFSLPLFCSNLLQQVYNLTDTALAGHLLGAGALAEIGATAALYGLIMNFAFGMNNGLALSISRHFGAGDGLFRFHHAILVTNNVREMVYGIQIWCVVTIRWCHRCTWCIFSTISTIAALIFPYENIWGEATTAIVVWLHVENDVITFHRSFDFFWCIIIICQFIGNFRRTHAAMQILEMQKCKICVGICPLWQWPVNGYCLVCCHPGITIVRIDKIQIFILILTIFVGTAKGFVHFFFQQIGIDCVFITSIAVDDVIKEKRNSSGIFHLYV